MIEITNIHIQNYLGERGLFPEYEYGNNAYYMRSSKLFSLLESYQIEFFILPNRL